MKFATRSDDDGKFIFTNNKIFTIINNTNIYFAEIIRDDGSPMFVNKHCNTCCCTSHDGFLFYEIFDDRIQYEKKFPEMTIKKAYNIYLEKEPTMLNHIKLIGEDTKNISRVELIIDNCEIASDVPNNNNVVQLLKETSTPINLQYLTHYDAVISIIYYTNDETNKIPDISIEFPQIPLFLTNDEITQNSWVFFDKHGYSILHFSDGIFGKINGDMHFPIVYFKETELPKDSLSCAELVKWLNNHCIEMP